MRILFLDTETNCLPKNRYAPYTYPGAWPAVVQIAWQVWDMIEQEASVCIQSASFLVKPAEDLVWDKESEAIHGISRKVAETGVDPQQVLTHLVADARGADMILIHNLAFDKPVVWAFSHRLGVDPAKWWPKHEMCTMLETVGICKIPSTSKYATEKDPYKWPKLEELYKILFPTRSIPTNLHDARRDVDCLVACVDELQRRRLVRLPLVPTRADSFVDGFRRVLRGLEGMRL
jgi:DNA polymerase-3 subunit epsilon